MLRWEAVTAHRFTKYLNEVIQPLNFTQIGFEIDHNLLCLDMFISKRDRSRSKSRTRTRNVSATSNRSMSTHTNYDKMDKLRSKKMNSRNETYFRSTSSRARTDAKSVSSKYVAN